MSQFAGDATAKFALDLPLLHRQRATCHADLDIGLSEVLHAGDLRGLDQHLGKLRISRHVSSNAVDDVDRRLDVCVTWQRHGNE
ncbi:MAG: hypothetical protein RLZZ43_1304 [Actinomycetota bacterium]